MLQECVRTNCGCVSECVPGRDGGGSRRANTGRSEGLSNGGYFLSGEVGQRANTGRSEGPPSPVAVPFAMVRTVGGTASRSEGLPSRKGQVNLLFSLEKG